MARRLHWWQWAVAIALLVGATLVCGIWGLIRHGDRLWQKTIADLAARGHPVTIAEYAATCPPVDRGLQDAWAAWCARGTNSRLYDHVAAVPAWLASGDTALPPAVAAELARTDGDFFAARLLLRDRTLVIGLAGHVRELLDGPIDQARMQRFTDERLSKLLEIRELANHLYLHALLAGGGEALDDLDCLHGALTAQAGSLIDAMIASAVAGLRDNAYLHLTVHRGLAPERMDAWMVEPPIALRLVTEGLVGERCLFAMWGSGSDADWWSSIGDRLTGDANRAGVVRTEIAMEEHLRRRGTAWPTPPAGVQRWLSPGAARIISSVEGCATSALNRDALHRAARLVARLALTGRKGTSLPADAAAFIAVLQDPAALSGGPGLLPLRYLRIDAHTAGVGRDPAATSPTYVYPAMLGSAAWTAPAGPGPAVVIGQDSVVLRLP